MPGPVVVATRDAGRVLATRLAARLAEPTRARAGADDPDAPVGVAAEAPFRAGETRLGPLAVTADVHPEPDGDGARVEASVRNVCDRPVRVASVILGLRWTGAPAGPLRFLRHGWQSWSFTGSRDLDEFGEPPFPSGPWLRGLHHAVGAVPPDRAGWHESDLVTVAGRATGGPACLLGALETGQGFGVAYLRPEAGALLLEAETWLDAELAPGAEHALEPWRVALGADADALLEDHAGALGRRAGARVARSLVAGWCSWYHFFHEVSEEIVLRNLDALARDPGAFPIDLVQIDDGYQREVGDWRETNARFPRGLAPVVAAIREAGFTPGLWTAPFFAVGASRVAREHPEWLLRRGGEPLLGILHPIWAKDGRVYVLDTSRDDVCEHLRATFRALVELGFPYQKLDFLYGEAMHAEAADPTLSRAARLRRGLDAVREGAGDEAFLLGCGCPLGAAVGVVDAMRIGPDVAPSWRSRPEIRIPGVEETEPATRSAVRSILNRAWMHRRLWQNDPDCLMARQTRTELDAGERRSLAAAIAATGGSVVFSDDVPELADAERAFVRDTLAAAREADALGLPGRARSGGVLAAEIPEGACAADAEGGAVAVVNAAEEERTCEPELAALGLDGADGEPEPLLDSPRAALAGGRLRVPLPAHAGALLRVRRTFPWAVFCDFDGTFSVQDVGSTLAQRHAADRRPAAWARYERGEITAWEYNEIILDGLDLPGEGLDAFLRDEVELDPGARALVAFCEARRVPFRVLSDGFDSNLYRLQQLHDVRFAFDANRLRVEHGRWRIEPGFPNPACDCGTGTCKRGRLEAFRKEHPQARAILIGNGRVSDLCGARAADLVFAKDSLAETLAAEGRPFVPFTTLRDVIPRLEETLGTG